MSDILLDLLSSFVVFVLLGFLLLLLSVRNRKKKEQRQAGGLGQGHVYKEPPASGERAPETEASAGSLQPGSDNLPVMIKSSSRSRKSNRKPRVLGGDQNIKIPDIFAQPEPERKERGRIVTDGQVVSGNKVRRDTEPLRQYPVVGDGVEEPDGSKVKTDGSPENYRVIDGSAAGDYGRIKTDEMPEAYQVIREDQDNDPSRRLSGEYQAGDVAAAWRGRDAEEKVKINVNPGLTAAEMRRAVVLAAVLGKPRSLQDLEEELY